MNEDQILGWLLHQKKHAEIPEVTDEMIEKLVETSQFTAVLFCKRLIFLPLLLTFFHYYLLDGCYYAATNDQRISFNRRQRR